MPPRNRGKVKRNAVKSREPSTPVQDLSSSSEDQVPSADQETRTAVASIQVEAEVHSPPVTVSPSPTFDADADAASPEAVAEAEPEAEADEHEEAKVPLGRKKKNSQNRHFLFTHDVEDSVVDWWRDHEFLYNVNHPKHMDKGLKFRVIDAKAEEIGCSSEYI